MGPDLTTIVEVEFDYVLANDFKVEMWSNLQTGTRPVPPPPLTNQVIEEAEPVLIDIRRASGNIKEYIQRPAGSFQLRLALGQHGRRIHH